MQYSLSIHSYIVLLLTTDRKGPLAFPSSRAVMEQHTMYLFPGTEEKGRSYSCQDKSATTMETPACTTMEIPACTMAKGY